MAPTLEVVHHSCRRHPASVFRANIEDVVESAKVVGEPEVREVSEKAPDNPVFRLENPAKTVLCRGDEPDHRLANTLLVDRKHRKTGLLVHLKQQGDEFLSVLLSRTSEPQR